MTTASESCAGADSWSLAQPRDYVAVNGDVEDEEMLAALLAKASRIVRDELAVSGYDLPALIEAGRVRADTACDVVVDMVAYALRSASGGGLDAPFGATQAAMTGGPYTQSATFATAVGSLSFTRVQRRRLGLPGRRAFEIDLIGGGS